MYTTIKNLLDGTTDFCIELAKKRESVDMPQNHFHDFYEIYYQLSGERNYFIKNRMYNVKKGDLIFINEYDLHKTTVSRTLDYSRILISFKRRFIEEILNSIQDIDLFYGFKNDINIITIPASSQAEIEMLLFNMLEECKNIQVGSTSSLKIDLISLLIFISRSAITAQTKKAEYHNVMSPSLFSAVQYINCHYDTKLNLKEISHDFGFSPYYFCRIFKEATGFTFTEYVNTLRVKQGCQLLQDTQISIIEIANSVGFESSTHFGRVFKSIMKVSPMRFRKIKK